MRQPEPAHLFGIDDAIIWPAIISALAGGASAMLSKKPASGGISAGGGGGKFTPTATSFTPGPAPGAAGGDANAAADAFNARLNNAPALRTSASGVGAGIDPAGPGVGAGINPEGAGVGAGVGGTLPPQGGGTDWNKVAQNAQLLGAVGTTVGQALSPDLPAGHVTPGRLAGTYDASVPGARERLAMLMRSIYGRG